jgi:hypothetical protein
MPRGRGTDPHTAHKARANAALRPPSRTFHRSRPRSGSSSGFILRIHYVWGVGEPPHPVLFETSAGKGRFGTCCGRVVPTLWFVLVFGAPTPQKRRASGSFRDLTNDQRPQAQKPRASGLFRRAAPSADPRKRFNTRRIRLARRRPGAVFGVGPRKPTQTKASRRVFRSKSGGKLSPPIYPVAKETRRTTSQPATKARSAESGLAKTVQYAAHQTGETSSGRRFRGRAPENATKKSDARSLPQEKRRKAFSADLSRSERDPAELRGCRNEGAKRRAPYATGGLDAALATRRNCRS